MKEIVKERDIGIAGRTSLYQLKNLPFFIQGVKSNKGLFLAHFTPFPKTLDKGEITPYTA